ncbi:MAG TPA: NADPH-dependent FMN reductase [Blastocatellia bacterium]|nr:NADPH-dependent FMN reductase [Blastocatellia bacterium]
MNSDRKLFIPVILGTTRQNRQSEHVARWVFSQLAERAVVETVLLDIREFNFPFVGESDDIKDPVFSATMERSDALVIVAPEYNHGYSGSLKHALDTCLKEYIHKAVGICGVSAGPFGGTRVIENLLPVMRELGLVTIFWDLNFGNVASLFDAEGNLLDKAYERRADKFIKELIWMATVLRDGRENLPVE